MTRSILIGAVLISSFGIGTAFAAHEGHEPHVGPPFPLAQNPYYVAPRRVPRCDHGYTAVNIICGDSVPRTCIWDCR